MFDIEYPLDSELCALKPGFKASLRNTLFGIDWGRG